MLWWAVEGEAIREMKENDTNDAPIDPAGKGVAGVTAAYDNAACW